PIQKGIEKFDVVLSDMAPKTTGIRITDQARSLELCEMALATAEKYLRPGGHFVCKLFHSPDFEGYRKNLKARFETVELLKPKSTRSQSKEIFFVCKSMQTR
ncbi:MAG: SAM-dependent methyltransferase, partial [Pseudobdellovibrionaceae bacterium]